MGNNKGFNQQKYNNKFNFIKYMFFIDNFYFIFLFRLFDHVINNSEYQEKREEENS